MIHINRIYIDFTCGDFADSFKAALKLVEEYGCDVEYMFNDVKITVDKRSTLEHTWETYYKGVYKS